MYHISSTDNYAKARLDLQKAENESDLQTKSSMPEERHRQRNRKYTNRFSSDEQEKDYSQSPLLKKVKSSQVKQNKCIPVPMVLQEKAKCLQEKMTCKTNNKAKYVQLPLRKSPKQPSLMLHTPASSMKGEIQDRAAIYGNAKRSWEFRAANASNANLPLLRQSNTASTATASSPINSQPSRRDIVARSVETERETSQKRVTDRSNDHGIIDDNLTNDRCLTGTIIYYTTKPELRIICMYTYIIFCMKLLIKRVVHKCRNRNCRPMV